MPAKIHTRVIQAADKIVTVTYVLTSDEFPDHRRVVEDSWDVADAPAAVKSALTTLRNHQDSRIKTIATELP